eukprot:comp22919_c1_seq1/m.36274 comp22919_c1_seq1/g.36274  ORF comp22919_c1_seq1/g.36274 comp22919_c1_seq1/m.36274 type:complete len:283 (-) comp22919_c1_seq1:219-1067(-)
MHSWRNQQGPVASEMPPQPHPLGGPSHNMNMYAPQPKLGMPLSQPAPYGPPPTNFSRQPPTLPPPGPPTKGRKGSPKASKNHGLQSPPTQALQAQLNNPYSQPAPGLAPHPYQPAPQLFRGPPGPGPHNVYSKPPMQFEAGPQGPGRSDPYMASYMARGHMGPPSYMTVPAQPPPVLAGQPGYRHVSLAESGEEELRAAEALLEIATCPPRFGPISSPPTSQMGQVHSRKDSGPAVSFPTPPLSPPEVKDDMSAGKRSSSVGQEPEKKKRSTKKPKVAQPQA